MSSIQCVCRYIPKSQTLSVPEISFSSSALLPNGERVNWSGGDQGFWTVHHEHHGLTTTRPAVRFKWTAMGFLTIESLASF